MNKSVLKSYAPQARKDFIAAVTARANLLGLSAKAGKLEAAASQPQGDVTIIAGQAWPIKVHGQRERLITRIQKDGFTQTMEAMAYTWFNRFAALRYMELHDYLGHGHRPLSSADGALPDILTHAVELVKNGELPGLKPALVADMKLAGNRDGELYRLLLVAQCNALNNAMPFLFERIDDETELLLPDNLLRTDSVIAKLVSAIDERDWKEVEIIGWLYQFYIADEKERVDKKLKAGSAVESHEIPAKTQLFTPNWVVQYLVQNSVGRLWLMANPASLLKDQWPYFIEPAKQATEVQVQLDAVIQTRINEDGGSLNAESITLLDPACGSGHILVEAYELLKNIYLERGYQPRTIPRLILEKNLFGMDIDDRAAQMAGFALLMKARADDRRLFNEPIKLNVLSLKDSKGLNADEIMRALTVGCVSQQIAVNAFGATDLFPGTRPQSSLGESIVADTASEPAQQAVAALIAIFSDVKTLGSLIQIPKALLAQLAPLEENLQQALESGDLYAKAAAQTMMPLVVQARVLGAEFDAVVANPPYMGNKGMNPALKNYAKATFPDSKSDLFAMFIERGFGWCKPTGFNSMVTMQSWMSLSSYEAMREKLLNQRTLVCMSHMGNGVMGIAFGTAATVFWDMHINGYDGSFSYCENDDIGDEGTPKVFPVLNERLKTAKSDDFRKIPGSTVAYWASPNTIKAFSNEKIGQIAETRLGMATADNNKFLRFWHEVESSSLGLSIESREEALMSKKRWFLYQKGGEYRKWYGNVDYVVNWENDGFEIQNFADLDTGRIRSHNYNLDFIFRTGITWNALSSIDTSARISRNSLFDNAGSSLFTEDFNLSLKILAFLNSRVIVDLIKIISPTLNYQPGDIAKLPANFSLPGMEVIPINAKTLIEVATRDWNKFETSWGFTELAFCKRGIHETYLENSWLDWSASTSRDVHIAKSLEEENNRIFIEAYSLQDELSPEVPESQITLARADREKDCQRLVSYAIGCMMGRYSLDAPGLIYAHAGNASFDPSRYHTFPADADGIVPLTDELWFEDDAANGIREFVLAIWGADTLAENMAWLAESLGTKASETPDETVRRYLADKFYKDHLQTYKKRPIYWLFSSGKQGAFQALVYLHRYHDGTLARLRAEYVVPLTGKIQSRIDLLQKDAAAASSTAARNKLAKEVEKLKKKHVELLAYDEQLRHYADMRITLDLDAGVKVNYGKFGDLLAEVKTVTGGASDD
jgi:hypothetical protein